MRLRSAPVLLLAICSSVVFSAEAMNHRTGGQGMGLMGGMSDARSGVTLDDARKKGLVATGLEPRFPAGHSCPKIASEFASPYRYDGSKRPAFRYAGLHGGIDISLPKGTPLLALARGVVIHKGAGGQATGVYIWLHFPPESTGLSKHLYAKYQHLKVPSRLEVGAAVDAGQIIGLSGATGTSGGHYGILGYAHLHLTTFAAPTNQFGVTGTMVAPRDGRMVDPVAVYLAPDQFDRVWRDPGSLSGMAVTVPARKRTDSPPPHEKILWPLLCD